ncbi:MAG: hypothetical protein KDG55_20650 [Rhodocyclaceae bacterium]|nr:hypothetical protein [Rhodocyclaceae bacterium]
MRRETAYKLAGRRHGEHHGTAVSGLQKEREIRFRPLPPNQVEQACSALRALRGLVARPSEKADTICVEYSILDYSLESLEKALTDAGFHLDNSLLTKLLRAFIYFSEDTQIHNLRSPERLLKQSNEVYIKVYDHHPHGDRDDTPLELREYK